MMKKKTLSILIALSLLCACLSSSAASIAAEPDIHSDIVGDVNADGRLNNKDLGLLQQYLNDWDVEIATDLADVNWDGKINNKDLGSLIVCLNGGKLTGQGGLFNDDSFGEW